MTEPGTSGRMPRRPPLSACVGAIVAASFLALALLATRPTVALAANPTPPFTECPAVGADASCAILIVIQPDGSLTVLADPAQKPFDRADDTLLGVLNNSALTVPSISIGSSTQNVFGFEALGSDGLCAFVWAGNGYCKAIPKPPTGYEGPDTRFSAISANKRDGTVNFTGPGGGLAAGASTYFSLENSITASKFGTGAATSLAYGAASARSSDFADPAVVTATLSIGANPVAGAPVRFTLAPGTGSVSCSGVTSSLGVVMCSLTPSQRAGPYQLVASYAGSSVPFLAPVNTIVPLTVTLEQDSLTYTGPTTAQAGQPLTLSAVMATDDPAAATPLGGRTVRFTLGPGSSALSCNGYTDPAGVASCLVFLPAGQPAGTSPATAAFANDPFYVPAQAAAVVTVAAPVIPIPSVGAAGGVPLLPALLFVGAGGAAMAASRRRLRARGGERPQW